MKTIIRGGLAVIIGLLVGGVVNMALILIGSHVIPPPPGVDVSDVHSMSAGMHLFQPKHFLFPFLAHACGTLVGSALAYLLAASHRRWYSYGIGVASLAGGIAAACMIPAPNWFIVTDLVLAYIPMACLGARLGRCFVGK